MGVILCELILDPTLPCEQHVSGSTVRYCLCTDATLTLCIYVLKLKSYYLTDMCLCPLNNL